VAKWRVKGRRSEPKMRIGEGQFAGLQIDQIDPDEDASSAT